MKETEDFSCVRKPAALTIAGSDSGGNAGIQADLRAFQVFGVHGCTVFAALTAQNPFGVRAVFLPEPEFVGQQIDAVLEPYGIQALKTGMLAAPEIIEMVADRLLSTERVTKIIDPVMVATSGDRLLREDAETALMERLLPLAHLITPNIPEAEVLAGVSGVSARDLPDLARRLADRYGCAVLLKGGHDHERPAEDLFFDGRQMFRLSTPIVEEPLSTHGTGCSLSAAITASAACGRSMLDAVVEGKAYVYESIRTAIRVGEVCAVLGTPATLPTNLVRVEELPSPTAC